MLVLLAALAAQQPVAGQLRGRVDATVITAVSALADSAAARGLPVDPLVEKAIEGGAKAAPSERIVAAVQAVFARLGRAQQALQGATSQPATPDVIAAGAFALSAGLQDSDVRNVARACVTKCSVAAALRTAGTLAALGVPSAETVELVRETLRAGGRDGDVAALPVRVEAQVARGATPAQAAAGLARAAAAGAPKGPSAPDQAGSPIRRP
jgi:hypothetical protein